MLLVQQAANAHKQHNGMGRQSEPNNGRQHVQKKYTTTDKVYSAQEEFPTTITNTEK